MSDKRCVNHDLKKLGLLPEGQDQSWAAQLKVLRTEIGDFVVTELDRVRADIRIEACACDRDSCFGRS